VYAIERPGSLFYYPVDYCFHLCFIIYLGSECP
jgi:hypothetical protein